MNIFYKSVFMILVWVSSSVFAAEDLKSYYEKQKAEIAPAFVAPSLGSEVRLKLSGGQVRSGILMKLSASSISVMTDSGMVDYKRSVLHESSRADFFVEDFAHVKAIEKTQEYKKQLNMTEAAKQAANIHEGSLYVSAKIDKSENKEVE